MYLSLFLDFLIVYKLLLTSVIDDAHHRREVLESARRNIYSSRQLFKLAQDAYKRAIPDASAPRHRPLLDASLELGLQVIALLRTK